MKYSLPDHGTKRKWNEEQTMTKQTSHMKLPKRDRRKPTLLSHEANIKEINLLCKAVFFIKTVSLCLYVSKYKEFRLYSSPQKFSPFE